MQLLYLILGIIILWASAEIIIKSLQFLSSKLKVSETFIGLTILSIGTSLPELGTHIVSSIKILKGEEVSGVALGTNIGSNIVQITAILGIVALFMFIKSDKKFLRKDYMVMLGGILLLLLFCLNGLIGRFEGFILALLYIFYIWKLGEKEQFARKVENQHSTRKIVLHSILLPIGILILLYSSRIVINNAEMLASVWGVRDTLIGALIIGVGTALPELATALVALKRKSAGMSVGVLIGSNITNPLFCIGIGALISGYSVDKSLTMFDIPFWFVISLIVLIFFWRKMKIEKKEAVALILLYVLYVALRLKYFAF